MAIEILKVVLKCLLIQGILTKSIQNSTIDDKKLVNIETLEAWKKNMTTYITDLFEKEVENRKKSVFFHARMPSNDVVYNRNSIVKFSNVVSNEGNHFNSGDSIFISPVSGVYLFSWTTRTYSAKTLSTELRVNNVVKERLETNLGGAVGRLSVTRVLLSKVNKNEHVWIQTATHFTENTFDYELEDGNSFIGVLLYET